MNRGVSLHEGRHHDAEVRDEVRDEIEDRDHEKAHLYIIIMTMITITIDFYYHLLLLRLVINILILLQNDGSYFNRRTIHWMVSLVSKKFQEFARIKLQRRNRQ